MRERISTAARRAELGAFLRSQRARLRPADVGLPADVVPGRRRTPGLRREEVAQLSGVSLTWYTWLEQGRNIAASEQVLDALARALRLDPDQRRHLRALAGLATTARGSSVDMARRRLQRLVDAYTTTVVSVHDANLDYVAWNEAYARIQHDPARLPADRRNLLWWMFTDADSRARMSSWEGVACELACQFRAAAGERPSDSRQAAIIAALADASPEFRRCWAQYCVRSFRPATIAVDHPQVGSVRLEVFQLRPVEHPDLLMVLQMPAGPDDLDRVAGLLGRPGV